MAPAPGIYAPPGTHRRPPLPSRPKETVTLDPANRERHGQRGATAADAANPRTQQPGGTFTCPGAPRLRRLQPELRTPGNFARRARTCPRCGDGVSLFAKGRPLAAALSCPSPSALAGIQPAAQRVPIDDPAHQCDQDRRPGTPQGPCITPSMALDGCGVQYRQRRSYTRVLACSLGGCAACQVVVIVAGHDPPDTMGNRHSARIGIPLRPAGARLPMRASASADEAAIAR
jgi:hypothetical protein